MKCRAHVIRRAAAGAVLAVLLPAVGLAAGADRRLVDAAKKRDSGSVGTLLAQRVDVNAPEADGTTALHWAVHHDDLATATLLVRAGARPNVVNDYDVTPLALAAGNGSAAMIELLLEAGADANTTARDGESVLMTAARAGGERAVTVLVAHGADLRHAEPARGQTALMWAIAERHAGVARVLVAAGADVRARSKSGFTPLLFAAQQGDLDMVTLLVGAGASVAERAENGATALLVATLRGHWALAADLLDRGADPNLDAAGYTPLHWAAGSWETELSGMFGSQRYASLAGRQPGKLELVKALLAHGANPNARVAKAPPRFGFSLFNLNLAGATPFLLASLAGEVDVMRLLLASGADPLVATRGNTTPLMAAAGIGRVDSESPVAEDDALEATKLALQLGGDVNAVNAEGETALHGAAYRGTDRLVRFLVEKGAKLNATNKYGWTPLTIAIGVRHPYGGGIVIHKSTADLLRALGGEAAPASAAGR